MSEYQYYEFQAIDRPLTEREMATLRGYSSRATITPTRFVNNYSYGSFKGNPGSRAAGFSERDASYLASGKPVIAQSTGLPICWFSSRRREMAEEAASGGDWTIRNLDRAYLQEFREPPEVIGVTGVER